MAEFAPGKVFLTGASAGLGLGFARTLLARGAEVFALNRRPPAELLQEFPDRFHFEACDLGRLDDVGPGIRRLLDGIERLDLVILNAGILNAGILGEFADMRDAELDAMRDMMNVNLWSNKVLLDELFAEERTVDEVWAISSGAAVNGHRGWNSYSISKAALNMLIKLYAAELPDTHFISLAPGLIDTGMQDFINEQPEALVQKFDALKRLQAARGTPDMPGPLEAAEKIFAAGEKLRAEDSGAFVDIRKV